MYESRLHATNGVVSLALDARNAELLELVNERTADNVIKSNCHPQAVSPFVLEIPREGGGLRRLCPPRYAQILRDPSLAPDIRVEQEERSARVRIDYPAVVEGDARRDVRVQVEIRLPEGDCRTQWKISLENGLEEEIQRVQFPCLGGIYLGDTWEDDEIVLPDNAGLRVKNPVRRLAEPPRVVHWKWQEYCYGYGLNGPCGGKDERGSHVLEYRYSGSGSMLWTDLFDVGENAGLYLTCRNDGLRLKAIRCETFGEERPGMGVAIVHFPCLQGGARWEGEPCVLALHEGDWHWAADDYRAWRTGLPQAMARRHRPEWFEKSAGLVAHYDFKYQGGGVVHRFRDIPELLLQARDMGMNHLLLSGWNFDGFDHGFPQYWPDPELGSEQELREAVHKVREMGGHLAFYINSRLCNTKYADRQDCIRRSAIMRRDGSLSIERYGAADLSFACMCNQDTAWRDEFVGVVNYLTHDIGADSMYLDQLAMARGELCYHPGHAEHAGDPAGWNQGYEKMLAQMRESYDEGGMALLYEGVSDIHGWGASGQLISTMFSLNSGSYPELYKYTFPEQILVDMMNPRRNSGMRAEHVARRSTFLLYRAFVTGSYFWVYDLEMDNTFRRDPEQYARLQKTVALRNAWLAAYGQGTFRDTVGLGACAPGMLAKRFALEGGTLVAWANEKRAADAFIDVYWLGNQLPKAVARTYHCPQEERPIRQEILPHGQGAIVRLYPEAEDELGVAVLR